MGSRVDVGPVNVRGALRARNARVIWDAGTLYVVSRRSGRIQRQTATTDEPIAPEKRDGMWRAAADDSKSIMFTRKGCGG